LNPVESFEAEFRQFVGAEYAAAVCNGSAAILNALIAIGMKPERAVITTPYTFPATANAVMMCGAKPLFVDIDSDTLCLDADKIEDVLTSHLDVAAILAVHLFGRMADVERIGELCADYGVAFVEDASQALGAKHKGRFAGTWGDAGTFSFYASKNLPTFEGGMIVTNRREVYEKILQIRNHGFNGDGEMVRFGFNYKMPWICAFLGQQYLKLHKPAIFAELGRYGPEDGYYSRLVYEHQFYRENPNLWSKRDCPIAEWMAEKIRKGRNR